MAIKTTRWDSAEHLKTEEDIRLYLEACLEEAGDDPAFIVHALGVVARSRNMSQLARDTGLSREGLYKALSDEGNPTFSTVAKVAKELGFKLNLLDLAGKIEFREDYDYKKLREGRFNTLDTSI